MTSPQLPQTFKRIVPTSHQTKTPHHIKEFPLPIPGKNQVLVKVLYTSFNHGDIAYLEGGYKSPINPNNLSPDVVGWEGSGEIVAVGTDLLVPLEIGTKVHITGPGTWSQYIVVNSETAIKIQDGLSLEEAACHFINPATMIYMTHIIQKGGHKAVIHSTGASALGRMFIRYLKVKGIKLINIVRKEEQIEELIREEGADYVLNSQDPDFESKLKELAEKEQATIAFDALAGDMTNILLRNMPEHSEVRVYGILSDNKLTVTVSELLFDRKVVGLYLSYYLTELTQSGKLLEFFKEIQTYLPTIFKTNIQKVYPMEDYLEVIDYYYKNSSKGKILLKPN